jgi:putative tricarboxylic transport membrane protein
MGDRITLVCIVVLAGFYFFFTSRIPSSLVGDPLGPRAFPNLLGVCLLICAGLLVGEMARKKKESPTIVATPVAGKPVWIVVAVGVWFAIYAWCFDRAGFILSTGVFLLGLMAYFHRRHWITNVVISVLFSVGAYFLFDKALGVLLPAGPLPF